MSQIPASLDALRVPTVSLTPFEGNPRRGDVSKIVESLERNGQYRPIVVNSRDNRVLAGNHTLAAARELGWDEIAATFVDVDAEQAARIVLVDNRSNDLAIYDDAELVGLLKSLPDFDGTGYEQEDLDSLLAALGVASDDRDTDPSELPEEPRTKPGDFYQLGDHRVLCGDSSHVDALDHVFGAGVDIGCVLTDPPYGIALDTDYSAMESRLTKPLGNGRGKTYRVMHGDDGPFDASFLAEYFSAIAEQFWFGADYYRRTLSGDDRDGSWLVWDKRNEASDAGYGSGFELLWSKTGHKRDLLRHYFFGAFGVEGANRMHPTQKPTPLLAEILNRWAPAGCVVADPYLGSGSTLIACENTGRTCFGLEIDSAYCDVIVDRWERHTGGTAELIGGGDRVAAT